MHVRCILDLLLISIIFQGSAFAEDLRVEPRVAYRTAARTSADSKPTRSVRYLFHRKSGDVVGVSAYRESGKMYIVDFPTGQRTMYAITAVELIEKLTDAEVAEWEAARRTREEKEAVRQQMAAAAREAERLSQIALLEAKERADRAEAARLEAEAKAAMPGIRSNVASFTFPESPDPSGIGASTGPIPARTSYRTSAPSSSSHSSGSSGGTVHVRGYTRKDGTYVHPHTRSAPRRK